MNTIRLAWSVAIVLMTAYSGNAKQTAVYSLTFESDWSATSHPSDFPSSAHFSGLIGTTHNASISYWTEGQPASLGIKQMAETGSKSALDQIFTTTDDIGSSDNRISAGGLSTSPSSITISFSASTSHPFLTLVSMIAPSPDWFVGVSGLPLSDQNGWIPSLVIDLFAYDAGTDSGTSYASSNAATSPPVPISQLVESPFANGSTVPRIGRFVLTLMSVTTTEKLDEVPSSFSLISTFPNPFSDRVAIEFESLLSENAQVQVFDVSGQLMDELFSGTLVGGRHSFEWDASAKPAGAYFVQFKTGRKSEFRTVHLVK